MYLPEHVGKGGEDKNPQHSEHGAEQDGHNNEHPVEPSQWNSLNKYVPHMAPHSLECLHATKVGTKLAFTA